MPPAQALRACTEEERRTVEANLGIPVAVLAQLRRQRRGAAAIHYLGGWDEARSLAVLYFVRLVQLHRPGAGGLYGFVLKYLPRWLYRAAFGARGQRLPPPVQREGDLAWCLGRYDLGPPTAPGGPLPGEAAARAASLRAAVSRQPARSRRLLESVLRGLSTAEAARLESISVGAARVALLRARRSLAADERLREACA